MENNTNANDKGKIMVLISLIIAVSILIVVLVFLAVINITHKDAKSKLSTTTRRTIKTEETATTTTEPTTTPSTTDIAEDNTTSVEPKTTTTRRTQTKGPASTATYTEVVTEKPTSSVIPEHNYDIATNPSTYPDALDSWEWEVVNLINQERRKNGLNEVAVARELRNMAEEGAYIYYASGSNELKSYLSGNSYLYMSSNLEINARTLYENTISSTKITTNPNIKYVGAGVLLKRVTLDTYYYVIIYE